MHWKVPITENKTAVGQSRSKAPLIMGLKGRLLISTPPRRKKGIHPSTIIIKGKQEKHSYEAVALNLGAHQIPGGSPTPTSIKSESLGVVPKCQAVLKSPQLLY